jgi:2-oxoisovalerate dehydrogenase E1 component
VFSFAPVVKYGEEIKPGEREKASGTRRQKARKCFVFSVCGQARHMSQRAARPDPVSSLFERAGTGKPAIGRDAGSVYSYAALIRKTEELLLRLFSQGLLSGTTHTCIGQELCAMSIVRALNDPADIVLSNHRNHGHFLTYSGNFLGLVAEIMGRDAGVCGGIGGSQHLAYRGFHSNGVQGGMTAIGVGHALALKRRGENGIVAAIIGDGTTGQGLLYESLNLASTWAVPMLFVVENNNIAQTTPTSDTVGGSLEARGSAFGLRTWHLNDCDPDFLSDAEQVVAEIRKSRKPGFLVIDTCRLGPHSKGDDLRGPEIMDAIRARDPLAKLGRDLDPQLKRDLDEAADEFLNEVYRQAIASPEAKPSHTKRHIFTADHHPPATPTTVAATPINVRVSLNNALDELLSGHPEVIVLGEDLHDPYGGAFKVTAGLSTRYPGRVISTPISEAGVVGAGIGLALAGYRPVVEIMFADFVSLAMDQIYNHAVKFPGMFPDARVPLVIRTPAGGRRGYGPTHSQSPENLMTGVPGLTIVFPSHRHDPGLLLRRAVLAWNSPTVFFEHKLLYARAVDKADYQELAANAADPGAAWFPVLTRGASQPDVSLVAYGDSVQLAESVAAQLAEEEVSCEIVAPSLLAPLPRATLVNHLLSSPRIVVIEEAPTEFGFAAELGSALLEAGYSGRYRRVASPPIPIPAARSLETTVLPSEQNVLDCVIETILADLAA